MEINKINDPYNCMVCRIEDRDIGQTGPLAGLRYMVKDIFDVSGVATTQCSLDYSRYRGIPEEDSWVVKCLRQCGAELIGKTKMHELALGVTGINAHFKTPENPKAPGRIPGGSSSGSAVAVAGGLVPFALGTDTGGSVRIPSGFCGTYGFRPTLGNIPIDGVVSLAPSMDTVGILAESASILKRVAECLVKPARTFPPSTFRKVFFASDSVIMSEPESSDAIKKMFDSFKRIGLSGEEINTGFLVKARDTQRVIQAAEAWSQNAEWVLDMQPNLGSDVYNLLIFGAGLSAVQFGKASGQRASICLGMERLLATDSVLILPCAPGIPPKVSDLANSELAFEFRMKTLCFNNLASITGLPVVAVPAAENDNLPVGVQIIGPRGSDKELLEIAEKVTSL